MIDKKDIKPKKSKELKKQYKVYLYPSMVENLDISVNKLTNSAVRDRLEYLDKESKK